MVFHWNLTDSKSPRLVSVFCNAVVWMVSTRALISKSSSSCTNSLVTVPRAPITTGIIVAFMLHGFFNSLARYYYYYYYYYFLYAFFPTSVSWWSFTGVWVTASLFWFPWFFLVFWPILTMLLSRWSSDF